MKRKDWILELCVYLLATLFLITAGSKLIDLKKFGDQINNQPFDNFYTPLLKYGVPLLEVVLLIGLMWPAKRLRALYGSAILMTVFTIYIGLVTFHFYDRVPCGCAFAFEKLTWPQHLAMNMILTVMAYYAIYMVRKGLNKQPAG